MIRRAILASAAAIVVALLAPAVPASAGGGCHAGPSTGDGTTVELVGACFTPTTLFVEPGDEVTFVNLDAMTHNVGGNVWGHFDDLREGDRFSSTFELDGVYAFACTYHPGMTGAIVVGDGNGAGNGMTVSTTDIEAPTGTAEAAPAAIAAAPAALGEPASTTAWLGGGAIGFAIGIAGALAMRRRSRASLGSS